MSYSYSSSTGSTKSLQCSFDGNMYYNASNSSIINITVSNYLFYDDCSSDRSSEYSERYTFSDSTGTATVSYVDVTNGYKVTTVGGGDSFIGIPISELNYKNKH